jgi:hypothetical protein
MSHNPFRIGKPKGSEAKRPYTSLLGRELPPEVSRLGHAQEYGVPASAGLIRANTMPPKHFKALDNATPPSAEAGTTNLPRRVLMLFFMQALNDSVERNEFYLAKPS